MIGFVPGDGPLHRTHPLTAASVVMACAAGAFAAPGYWSLLPVGVALLLVAVERVPGVLKPAAVLCLPLLILLLLIHGVLGDAWMRALVLGSRLTTLMVVFLVFLASVHPGRLVDALIDLKIPFSAVYLLSATLQIVPLMRDRAAAVLEAQRCRGLRAGGGIANRIRVLIPLTVPLVMGSLAGLDERTLALETRGAAAGGRKTPLNSPKDSATGKAVRWLSLAAIPVLAWLKLTRW